MIRLSSKQAPALQPTHLPSLGRAKPPPSPSSSCRPSPSPKGSLKGSFLLDHRDSNPCLHHSRYVLHAVCSGSHMFTSSICLHSSIIQKPVQRPFSFLWDRSGYKRRDGYIKKEGVHRSLTVYKDMAPHQTWLGNIMWLAIALGGKLDLLQTFCMTSRAVIGNSHDHAGARPGTPTPPSSCLGQACSVTAPQSASSHHQSQCKCTAAAQGSLGSLAGVPGHRGWGSTRPCRGFVKRPWWAAPRSSPCPADVAGTAGTAGTACRSACAAWALHAGAGPSQAALHATSGWPSRGCCAPAPTAWTQL